jgi:dynein heavy chain
MGGSKSIQIGDK